MCAQGSFENIIFGGRNSQNAVLLPTPANRHLLAVRFCVLFVSQYTVSPIAFPSFFRGQKCKYGPRCSLFLHRSTASAFKTHSETLCGGSRPWQAEVSSRHGVSGKRHGCSPTQRHLYGKPKDQKNPQTSGLFWIKLAPASFMQPFFLWRLEQKHTCKSVS